MQKITVEVMDTKQDKQKVMAAVLPFTQYDWYLADNKRIITVGLKQSVNIYLNDKFGVRESSDGKSIRLITEKEGPTKVYTIDTAMNNKLMKSSSIIKTPYVKAKPPESTKTPHRYMAMLYSDNSKAKKVDTLEFDSASNGVEWIKNHIARKKERYGEVIDQKTGAVIKKVGKTAETDAKPAKKADGSSFTADNAGKILKGLKFQPYKAAPGMFLKQTPDGRIMLDSVKAFAELRKALKSTPLTESKPNVWTDGTITIKAKLMETTMIVSVATKAKK